MRYSVIVLFVLFVFVGCKQTYKVPDNAELLSQKVKIFPDYTDVTVPYNIAPLNFVIRQRGDAFVVEVKAKDDRIVVGTDKHGVIEFDLEEWHSFTASHKGQSLEVTVYVQKDDAWYAYKPFNIAIANEEIDNYVSYRLIEPGYELYRQLGLYQRNVTNYDVQTIYENKPRVDEDVHCINCHNFQNYSAKNMTFHVRQNLTGTIMAHDGKVKKINPKNDSILGNAVYPAWHPTQKWIVYSSNKTGQAFHIKDLQKIECMDYSSDIIFYDVEKNEISNIFKSSDKMETFPAWSPTGDRLYYCIADIGLDLDSVDEKTAQKETGLQYYNIKYNIMSVPFDQQTRTFGEPRLEVDCKSLGLSGTLPRISPDGRYMLFTMGEYGQFHIWHKSSDQYVKNLETGEYYPLTAANSKNSESFHNWSSNGRWIVFTTRRDDGVFTRLYFAYFDKDGKAHKAFMLPQEHPLDNVKLFKSYNVPEITKDAVPYKPSDFKEVIYKNPLPVKYVSIR
jgi:hypothetical protein